MKERESATPTPTSPGDRTPWATLRKKENWVTNRYNQSNPHVKAEDVYEIYIRSTKKDYDSFGSKAGRWFNNLFS